MGKEGRAGEKGRTRGRKRESEGRGIRKNERTKGAGNNLRK